MVDKDVSSVTELVPAITGATLTANGLVVRRCAEAGANAHSFGVDAVIVEVFDHELQLVEEGLAENDVLGPHLGLSV